MLRVHLCALVLAAGCGARPEQPVRAPVSSPQIRAATPVGFAPLPAALEGFPPALDDVALMHMYEYGEGFAFTAFFEEDDGLRLWSDLLDHQRRLADEYDDTPEGRLERQVDAHYRRFRAQQPETAVTLLELLDAAEAVPLYDVRLVAHLWRHGRTLSPAPVDLFARLDRHVRVVRAVQLGGEVTGPALRMPMVIWQQGPIEPLWAWGRVHVPAGLAAAARQAFPAADAARWDNECLLPLSLTEGAGVLVRRGSARQLAPGEALELRRLDVLRAPEAVTLQHAVLGDIHLPARSELTAWNVRDFLTDEQREAVRLLVKRMLAADREARATFEAMLPAAQWALRDALANHGIDTFDYYRRTLLRFDAAL